MTERGNLSYSAQESGLACWLNFVFGGQQYAAILVVFGGLHFGYNYEVNFCTLVTAFR